VPAGDLSTRERRSIDRAIGSAQRKTGKRFSVYIGPFKGAPRPAAMRLLEQLGDAAAESVLIAVDPATHRLEIVTGATARDAVDDRTCAKAALVMTAKLAGGNLAGGIVDGVKTLGG
jgi:uncharacterized membrane protein YgcG